MHALGVYANCKDVLTQGQTTSGVYTIQPDNQPSFQAYGDMETDGGGWTVFQRRMDGSVDFYRYWIDYQQGFGNVSGDFWLGLDKIHRLTSTATELRVDMQDFEGNSAYAKYTSFSVGDSSSKYTLTVSGYSGTAGDSLAYHNGQRFSTRDQDNDPSSVHCAFESQGAWWHRTCFYSNLNANYYNGLYTATRSYWDGVVWSTWKGYSYSLRITEMKVKQI